MQDDEKCKNSAWLKSLIHSNCDIMKIIDQVITNRYAHIYKDIYIFL